jgi:hypothetical protein
MKKILNAAILGLFLSLSTSQVFSAVIFWDVAQTLVNIDKKGFFFNELGFGVAIEGFFYTLFHPGKSFKKLKQQQYLDALASIPCHNPSITIYADDGVTQLPPLLTNLMLGTVTWEDAKTLCDQWLASNACTLKHKKARNFFLKTFEMNFNPQKFIRYLKPIKSNCKLLKQCAQQKDMYGYKKNINIILSNFARDAIQPFKEKFCNHIMRHIDGEVFSGTICMAKPCQNIYDHCYEYVCKNFPGRENEPFYFIDDQAVNRDAATQNKKKAFICAHPNDAQELLTIRGTISSN